MSQTCVAGTRAKPCHVAKINHATWQAMLGRQLGLQLASKALCHLAPRLLAQVSSSAGANAARPVGQAAAAVGSGKEFVGRGVLGNVAHGANNR